MLTNSLAFTSDWWQDLSTEEIPFFFFFSWVLKSQAERILQVKQDPAGSYQSIKLQWCCSGEKRWFFRCGIQMVASTELNLFSFQFYKYFFSQVQQEGHGSPTGVEKVGGCALRAAGCAGVSLQLFLSRSFSCGLNLTFRNEIIYLKRFSDPFLNKKKRKWVQSGLVESSRWESCGCSAGWN